MKHGMPALTRRRFLTYSGVFAAAAVVGGAGAVGVSELLDANAARSDNPVLVLVTMYGGNDGLNTVIPAGDHTYQDERPELAFRPEEVLDLGEGLGLNPGMTRTHQLWTAGRLRIVRGVGYPGPNHSHFSSMAIWQTASPQTPVRTGWIGRWLDVVGADPIRAVSLESTLPPMMAGATAVGSVIRPDGLAVPGSALGDAIRDLGRPSPSDSSFEARVASSMTDMFTVAQSVDDAVSDQDTSGESLATQLNAIATLIAAGTPTQVYSASLNGFDTHTNERDKQQKMLAHVDAALGDFTDAIAEVKRPVVVIVYSEFGRRVRANGGHGTDHGTAGPVLILGNGIKHGFHGEQPSLANLDNGDLRYTVDFRDIYASALEEVLQADSRPILNGWAGRVPLLA